jgi:hypothetical protein
MQRILFVLLAGLMIAGTLAAQPSSVPAPLSSSAQPLPSSEIPQIVAFDKDHFLGDHTHIFADISKLGKWNNSISSMIILSGTWQFFDDDGMKGTAMKELGPGLYPDVRDVGMKDNSISSIRLVSPREQLTTGPSKRPASRPAGTAKAR